MFIKKKDQYLTIKHLKIYNKINNKIIILQMYVLD